MSDCVPRVAFALSLLAAPGAALPQAPPAAPRWYVCLQMLPGRPGAPPYYRDCRPIPAACAATPTCACMARAMPDPFRHACRRVGRRFIRGTVALP